MSIQPVMCLSRIFQLIDKHSAHLKVELSCSSKIIVPVNSTHGPFNQIVPHTIVTLMFLLCCLGRERWTHTQREALWRKILSSLQMDPFWMFRLPKLSTTFSELCGAVFKRKDNLQRLKRKHSADGKYTARIAMLIIRPTSFYNNMRWTHAQREALRRKNLSIQNLKLLLIKQLVFLS